MSEQQVYQRKYRSNPEGKRCGCGRPAVAWQRDGWACAQCLAWEESYYKRGAKQREWKAERHPQMTQMTQMGKEGV